MTCDGARAVGRPARCRPSLGAGIALRALLGIALSLAVPGFALAVSFDCSKAATKTEQAICADAELSKLDEGLARAYAGALKRARPREKVEIRNDQSRWIEKRDSCPNQDHACIAGHYRDREKILVRFRSGPLPGEDPPHLKREADKLAEILRTFGLMAPEYVSSTSRSSREPFCKKLFDDMAASTNLRAIEPDVRALSEEAPGMEKWQHCNGKELREMEDVEMAYQSLGQLGGPPYRYYRIDLDGKPGNGKEDLVYHGLEWSRAGVAGHLGYTWVDLKKCMIRQSAPLSVQVFSPNRPETYNNLNVLAEYRGESIVLESVAEFAGPPGSGVLRYRFHVWRFGERKPILCAWQ